MYEFESDNPVIITQFKWAGNLWPLRIKSHCDECDLVSSMLRKMIEVEFKDKNVVFELKPWLNSIFYCLARGAWHAPIIMVNGKKFYQFSEKKPLFDRAKLIELVNEQFLNRAKSVRDMEHKHVRLSYNQIEENIFAGNNLCCQVQFDEELLSRGIYTDISLEAERMDNPKGVRYFFWFPWLEDTAPSMELINLGLNVVDELLAQNIKMYVHCRNGHGRTTTFLASYYIRKMKISADEALNVLKSKRPSGHLNRVQKAFLDEFAKSVQ